MYTPSALPDPIGESTAFLDFQSRLSEVAKVDRPVLIIGERGTGKEMAARRLHYLSQRWDEALVTLNCAALSPNLLEDELFGHEAGSFTGASKRRRGRFETANRGTLFLDEIGQTPTELQSKILRVVEYNSFERVGSSETIEVDVRIIGATNSDLYQMAINGKFKHDLLDRLSFDVIFVPPLRVREGDIILLANHFAARMSHELGKPDIPEFTDEILLQLEQYEWPGNVRELKNVIERAVYRSHSNLIESIELNPFHYPFGNLQGSPTTAQIKETSPTSTSPTTVGSVSDHSTKSNIPESVPTANEDDPQSKLTANAVDALGNRAFKDIIQEIEVELMRAALNKAAHNQRKAAQILDLTYHQWRGLYRKYENEFTIEA